MSLELTIVEFMLGVIAGTVSGLFIVKRMGRNALFQKNAGSRRFAKTKPRAMPRQAKVRSARRSSLRRLRPLVQPSPIVSVEPTVTRLAATVSSCPTCGLEAPAALMAEHFLGSPSHEKGTPEPVIAVIEDTISGKSGAVSEEDEKSSLRHLLQMLVPPRAFGRRHQQRTVNPLSHLVQTVEDAQSKLVRPLKGSK